MYPIYPCGDMEFGTHFTQTKVLAMILPHNLASYYDKLPFIYPGPLLTNLIVDPQTVIALQ